MKKVQCYECKGGHMKSECLNKGDEKKNKKDRRNKILKATLESDEDESLDELLHEFYFMVNDRRGN